MLFRQEITMTLEELRKNNLKKKFFFHDIPTLKPLIIS